MRQVVHQWVSVGVQKTGRRAEGDQEKENNTDDHVGGTRRFWEIRMKRLTNKRVLHQTIPHSLSRLLQQSRNRKKMVRSFLSHRWCTLRRHLLRRLLFFFRHALRHDALQSVKKSSRRIRTSQRSGSARSALCQSSPDGSAGARRGWKPSCLKGSSHG